MKKFIQDFLASPHSKYAAVLLAAIIINFTLAPLAAVTLRPKNAQAQSELMMPLMILTMIFQMISSLMQMGGGQQGGGEEQAPQYPSVGPANSGAQPGTNSSASGSGTTTSTLCSQTVFMTGSGSTLSLVPSTVTVGQNGCVNVLNGTTANANLLVRKKGETTGTNKEITTNNLSVLQFATVGEYELCSVSGTTTTCHATLKVQ